jgi:hypothetical protein
MQIISNVRSDFEERFVTFKRTYDRASNKEERNYVAKQFLMQCTEDEVSLVRSVIGDTLHHR